MIGSLGSVRLDGMPKRQDYKDEKEFEDAVNCRIALLEKENASMKIVEFREKKPRSVDMKLSEDQRYKEVCLSNLNNSSVYIFEAWFLDFLRTMVTKKDKSAPLVPALFKKGGPEVFSDFGKHVFKWLTETGQLDNFPIYSYVLPQKKYWRDAGTGESLREANMNLLDGVLPASANIGFDGLTKHETKDGNIWKGENVFIHPSAYVSRSIIGPNVVIGPNARIIHSVIGANTEIKEGVQIWGTVVFPKHRNNPKPNIIRENVQISDCLFLGGEIEPNSVFRKVQIYDPYGGVAVGSLNGETKYSQP
jgi:NDP-sugar pyrophosphorylase family protein